MVLCSSAGPFPGCTPHCNLMQQKDQTNLLAFYEDVNPIYKDSKPLIHHYQ